MLIQLEVASLGMLLNTNAGEDSFKKSVLGVGRKVDLKRLDQCLKQRSGVALTSKKNLEKEMVWIGMKMTRW